MPRLFIGILPEPEVRSRIARLLDFFLNKTPGLARPAVKWIAPENLHLTLRFLGKTRQQDVPRVRDALLRVASSVDGSFQVALSGVGSFCSRNGSRAIWAGVREGSKTLSRISAILDTELAKIGIPPDPKPFHAHLTFARTKGSSAALEQMIEQLRIANPVHLKFSVSGLTLFESITLPSGAVYREQACAKFGAPVRSSPRIRARCA